VLDDYWWITGGVTGTDAEGEAVRTQTTEVLELISRPGEGFREDILLPLGPLAAHALVTIEDYVPGEGGSIFLFGGQPLSFGGDAAVILDSNTETWGTAFPSGGPPREDAYAGLVVDPDEGNEIVVTGGFNRRDGVHMNSTQIYNVERDEWRDGPDLPLNMAAGNYVQLPAPATFLVVAGLETEEPDSNEPVLSTRILGYEPDDKEWLQFPERLQTARMESTAILLPEDFFNCS